jgi:Rieske Fe-S protein
MSDGLGRRDLLRCGAACALAAGCGKWVKEPVAIEAGAPTKGVLSVPTARIPELSQAGGSVLLHADAVDFIGRRVSVLVANTTSQGLRAYGAYCPHAGCEVAWVDGEDSVVCPCHLSRFAVDGAVTHPPALVDLDTYPAKLAPDGQVLIVDLNGAAGVFPAAVNGEVGFAVEQLPALAAVGGSVTGHSAGVPFPLVVLRASSTQMLAFDARCPHLGCAVSGAGTLFICPCHGSLFNLDGTVKTGPAAQPLTGLEVTFDGTNVVVKVPA